MFKDATVAEINIVMEKAWKAFHLYRKLSLKQRAAFYARHCGWFGQCALMT